jgi:hypothetical protein
MIISLVIIVIIKIVLMVPMDNNEIGYDDNFVEL